MPVKRRSKKKSPLSGSGAAGSQTPKPAELIGQVTGLAQPLCDAQGLELVHVQYRREAGGRVLRVYIDKPGGVNLDDCSQVSRELSDLIDIYVESEAPYNLEVSSPGIDRPLVKPDDFRRFEGSRAKIKINRPLEGRKNFKGIIQGVSADNETVHLLMDDKTVAIPFIAITNARLDNFNGVTQCR